MEGGVEAGLEFVGFEGDLRDGGGFLALFEVLGCCCGGLSCGGLGGLELGLASASGLTQEFQSLGTHYAHTLLDDVEVGLRDQLL